MLTEIEKQKIQLEEKYRDEVRKALSEKEAGGFSLMNFLNSNVGSFLLSTVIVGLISFYYNNRLERIQTQQEEAAAARETAAIVNKLKTELVHRLQNMVVLDSVMKGYEMKNVYLAYLGSSVANGIGAEYYNFRSLYGEYADHSLVRLVDALSWYESTPELTDLREKLVEINGEVVTLSDEYFYAAKGKRITLPKNVKPKLNEVDGNFYYFTRDKQLVILGPDLQQLFDVSDAPEINRFLVSANKVIKAGTSKLNTQTDS